MLILATNMWVWLLGFLFAVVCLFMTLVVLIQKPKGGGLSGAFGGAGGGSAQAAFGAKTGDVLTWFTVVCFVLFLFLAMGLQWMIRADHAAVVDAPEANPLEEAVHHLTGGSTPGSGDAADGAAGLSAQELDVPDPQSVPVQRQDLIDAAQEVAPGPQAPVTTPELPAGDPVAP